MWKCKKCETNNEDSALSCVICYYKKEEKPKFTSPAGSASDKWMCKCGYNNLSTSKFCKKCGGNKTGVMPEKRSSWICEKCGTRNPVGQLTCSSCTKNDSMTTISEKPVKSHHTAEIVLAIIAIILGILLLGFVSLHLVYGSWSNMEQNMSIIISDVSENVNLSAYKYIGGISDVLSKMRTPY